MLTKDAIIAFQNFHIYNYKKKQETEKIGDFCSLKVRSLKVK